MDEVLRDHRATRLGTPSSVPLLGVAIGDDSVLTEPLELALGDADGAGSAVKVYGVAVESPVCVCVCVCVCVGSHS